MTPTVFIDTETTGLSPGYDEVLQIGIVDDAGRVLLDTLICPTRLTDWPDPQEIHGITPVDVVDAPTLDLFLPAIFFVLILQLPTWLFLGGFLFLLALFWSTFRTQVPFYASGRAAWDAIVQELPVGPLRVIDIASGMGGLAANIARRRRDCEVEGIELAPLPWLVSRLRQMLGAPVYFHRGDYRRVDLGNYDVVIAYLSPAAMPALWDMACAQMRPGSLLLSHEFNIPGMPPHISRETRPGGPILFA